MKNIHSSNFRYWYRTQLSPKTARIYPEITRLWKFHSIAYKCSLDLYASRSQWKLNKVDHYVVNPGLMTVKLLLILLAGIYLSLPCYSQNSYTASDKILGIPAKFAGKVNSRITSIEGRLKMNTIKSIPLLVPYPFTM